MAAILLYVPRVTNRLRYVIDLLFGEQLGLSVEFTTNIDVYNTSDGPKCVYGDQATEGDLFFKSTTLLFEREIASQDLRPFSFGDTQAFFPVYHKRSALPFDVFAAVFYLVSRYEEYLPYASDQHNRFEASSSILSEIGMLQKPIVNIWCMALQTILAERFPKLKFKQRQYSFLPTYDIDAAWAYRQKGLYRTLGAYAKDLVQQDWTEMKQRSSVLFGKQKDPFDTFELQLQLQKQYKLRPAYFILFADYGVNDKNIPVRNTKFCELIRMISDYADVGIHPSYNSFGNKSKLRHEISRLSLVLNQDITMSRQHFLRMNLPATYHTLIDFDITDDFTMGYATQPGFRAGIADSFLFYDLDHDMVTPLRVHPFHLMDGTLRDYMQLNPAEAIKAAAAIIAEVKAVNGTFVSLWHNETLSDKKRWIGWLEVYRKIIEMAIP